MFQNDDNTREILDKIRNLQENVEVRKKCLINEADEKKEKPFAITDDPKFGQKVLSSQIEQFKSIVDGGAEFTDPNEEDVASSPLIFIPSTKNLIFSGTIPALNNLKFQFKLRTDTGFGCFIWADGLILTEENLKTIHKIQGFYKNWQSQWNQEGRDLEMMAKSLSKK